MSHRAAVFDAEATTWFPGTISSYRTTEDNAQIFDITRGTSKTSLLSLMWILNPHTFSFSWHFEQTAMVKSSNLTYQTLIQMDLSKFSSQMPQAQLQKMMTGMEM